MTHPLTDEMIQSIWDKVGNDIVDAKDEDLDGFVEDDLMRTAYDLAVEHVSQLWNQCFEKPNSSRSILIEFEERLQSLRPQQQENNQ